jgi:hypothetical protein
VATRDDMTISRYGRGTCPVCDRDISLTKAGVVRHHASDVWYAGRRQYRCQGAGQKPKVG